MALVGAEWSGYHPDSFAAYLKSDGTVGYRTKWKWPIGAGATSTISNPVQESADGTGLSGVVAISTGSAHTVYLKSDGTVGGGKNTDGGLGAGRPRIEVIP